MKISNENKEPSAMQHLMGSAAGVAAGSAIGHAVGKALSNKIEPQLSQAVESVSSFSKTNEDICSVEIRKFFECASQKKQLENCKIFHNLMLECQERHQFQNVKQTELN
ncbi:coiled-coil-helix-coiled-coil-helix domain-containing protein 2-like isoform X3 [Belonocnema kinseyi]|nr:coiled-coil-helix-coiled-coil-helix domain-containing protein 2-like isoform X3 [Belonocnema kinseyi]